MNDAGSIQTYLRFEGTGPASSLGAAPVPRKLRVKPLPPIGHPAEVAAVIPCYNYARYLPEAVESVLSQQDVGIHVVVVDDASTDDSLAVARTLASRDSRITVIANGTNRGPVETFNTGLAACKGEFLVRLDADDLLTPGSLQRSVAVMRAFPSVGLVYGHPLHFAGNEPPDPRLTATGWTVWPGHEWLAGRCESGCNVITSPEVLMRRSLVDRLGGQKPLAHTHDMEMWLRLSAFGDVAYIHGADQAWHREHSNSLSAREVDPFKDLLERRDAFEVLFAGPAGQLPGAAEWARTAMAAIANDAVELAVRRYDHPVTEIEIVHRLRDIARSLSPNTSLLGDWQGLERRMAMGSKRASRHPVFFLERVARGLRGIVRRHRWHRNGV